MEIIIYAIGLFILVILIFVLFFIKRTIEEFEEPWMKYQNNIPYDLELFQIIEKVDWDYTLFNKGEIYILSFWYQVRADLEFTLYMKLKEKEIELYKNNELDFNKLRMNLPNKYKRRILNKENTNHRKE